MDILFSLFFLFVYLRVLYGISRVLRKYIQVKRYVKNFNKTTGVCIDDHRVVGLSKRGAESQPSIVYTVENQQYEILSKVIYGGIAGFMMKGRKFKVLYNPKNPQDAVLKNELATYLLVCFLFVLFTAISFLLFYYDIL